MKLKDFFQGLVDYKRQCGSCEKTVKDYMWHLQTTLANSIGDIELNDLRQIDIGKVIEAGRAHGRFGSLRGAVVFRQLLRYIKEAGYKLDFDWRDIRLPSEPHKKVEWLDKDEMDMVRACFDLQTLSGLRGRALVEILRVTGMRISEALSLNREDIDWEKKEAEITNGKSKEREMIYFNDECISWLKRYMNMRNDRSEALFVTNNGKRVLPCTIRNTLHNATKNSGIRKRVHPHIFRSTFGTELLQGGVDIKSVQALMRHKSERTTLKHYIAVSKDRCKSEHERIMNVDKSPNNLLPAEQFSEIKKNLVLERMPV
jgi:site-specific recombinase XerD